MFNALMTYMEKGGIVNYIIVFVCFVAVHIGLGKLFMYWSFKRSNKAIKEFLKNGEEKLNPVLIEKDWLLSYFLRQYKSNLGGSPKFLRNKLREMLLHRIPTFEKGLDTMASWVAVAPLLGLLGTVVGMVKTFSIITRFGVGNPNLLSEGISVSLLTTQAGLVVAFPCLLFHNFLLGQKNALVKEIIADSEKLLNWIELRTE